MMANNIVAFPKQKIVRGAIESNGIEDEEVQKAKEKSVQNYVDSIVDELTECILCEFDNNGIERSEVGVAKDINMARLMLKSAVYRSMNKHFLMHDFLDNLYDTVMSNYIKETDDPEE
jgi:hypothetical protein